ncbi:unnamed protein product [Somion occarium]|uniref:Zn(2)-C6 fungal-type domain-containing protein n=1 Tax=Somion occarium TaxID=3059160 RepID=A0ABP1D2C0_9APHY
MPGNLQADGESAPTGQSRHKQPRSHSPGPSSSNHPSGSRPPPTKRARKAINCEPCRNSKLKCDRNRPCSSCILRGTTAHCYQGQEPEASARNEDSQQSRVDPGAEFNRIRHSLSLLESYVYQHPNSRPPIQSAPPPVILPSARHASTSTTPGAAELARDMLDYERPRTPAKDKAASSPHAPGMLGQQGTGGYYAGPTSAVSHLIMAEKEEDSSENSGRSSYERGPGEGGPSSEDTSASIAPTANVAYDKDLVAMLPPVHTVDGLVEYYFEYCNWIYRHVNQPAFLAAWERFKTGLNGDRIILATVCILISLTVRYLPPGHALLASLMGSVEDIGRKYYDIMLETLDRYRRTLREEGHGKGYTLELVELLLVRCHYLTYAKEDPEETWSVRGELVSMGTAMGLHRDPGNSRFPRAVAERRRWAWWHIVLLERWQAFMFGRPLAIASHHFNTRLPSYCEPALDKSGRLYLPNIALFRLAYILGDIMEDAVSFRAVSYSSIQEGDKLLTQWMDNLPPEMDLDEYHIARSLGSPIVSIRRLGVQSVIIRTAYYHIRFTLHRPYAHIPTSLEIAVSAASALISLVGQARPDFLSNTALAVPGHMNWGPFHIFSAAMFFSFQLISHPDQPAASLFRENIRKATSCLEQSRWMPVADKALTILQALAPLYSDSPTPDTTAERERKKADVLNLVKTLAFPYQEPPQPRSMASPALSGDDAEYLDSPNTSRVAYEHPQVPLGAPAHAQHPVSSLRYNAPVEQANAQNAINHTPHMPSMAGEHQMLLPSSSSSALYPAPSSNYTNGQQYNHHGAMEPQAMTNPGLGYNAAPYTYPADESSMWGASIGFGLAEWSQFVDYVQRPDTSHRGRGGGQM